MENQTSNFTIQWVKEETPKMRLICLNGDGVWSFIPGQIAVLKIEEIGESYFAIASAPEDKYGMEFIVKEGRGVAAALFEKKKGDEVQGKGPVGKGFPIDQHYGRDLILAAVGSAISPMRSVLRSVCYRRADFGKVQLVYGVRHPEDFPLLDEMKEWERTGIELILVVSQPELGKWQGKTGHVQLHFGEAVKALNKPVAMICGMKEMMEQSRDELIRLGIDPDEILTNY